MPDAPQTVEERMAAARRRAEAAFYMNHSTTAFRQMRKLAEDVLMLADEVDRAENKTRKRAYEDFIDDAEWISDEGETETLRVDKARLSALIGAFWEDDTEEPTDRAKIKTIGNETGPEKIVEMRHEKKPLFISREQSYYWSSEWQRDIRESMAALEAGDYEDFDSDDPNDVVRWLLGKQMPTKGGSMYLKDAIDAIPDTTRDEVMLEVVEAKLENRGKDWEGLRTRIEKTRQRLVNDYRGFLLMPDGYRSECIAYEAVLRWMDEMEGRES